MKFGFIHSLSSGHISITTNGNYFNFIPSSKTAAQNTLHPNLRPKFFVFSIWARDGKIQNFVNINLFYLNNLIFSNLQENTENTKYVKIMNQNKVLTEVFFCTVKTLPTLLASSWCKFVPYRTSLFTKCAKTTIFHNSTHLCRISTLPCG